MTAAGLILLFVGLLLGCRALHLQGLSQPLGARYFVTAYLAAIGMLAGLALLLAAMVTGCSQPMPPPAPQPYSRPRPDSVCRQFSDSCYPEIRPPSHPRS